MLADGPNLKGRVHVRKTFPKDPSYSFRLLTNSISSCLTGANEITVLQQINAGLNNVCVILSHFLRWKGAELAHSLAAELCFSGHSADSQPVMLLTVGTELLLELICWDQTGDHH